MLKKVCGPGPGGDWVTFIFIYVLANDRRGPASFKFVTKSSCCLYCTRAAGFLAQSSLTGAPAKRESI